MRNFQQKKPPISNNPLNQKLIEAASKHNLLEVQALVQQGANVNYVHYTGGDAWYKGNSSTALYQAVHTNFQNEQAYIAVIDYLLSKGADPNFQATRGGWNHYNTYPIFSNVVRIMSKLSSDELRLYFIQMFVKKGININVEEHQGRQKDFKVWETHNCFIFDILDLFQLESRVDQLKKPFAYRIIDKMRKQKQAKHKTNFQEEFPNKIVGKQQQQQHQQNQPEQEQEEQKNQQAFMIKPIEKHKVDMIIKILKMGVKPNSSVSSSRWENFNIHNYTEENMDLAKYQSYEDEYYQNLLHRAISYNIPELVKYLLEQGAMPSRPLKYTVSKLFWPNQWPEKLKKYRTQSNKRDLKQFEQEKQKLEKSLLSETVEQNKISISRNIRYYDYLAYKCKIFSIENQCPVALYQVKEISCVELAQKFKADPSIIELLQAYKKQQKQYDQLLFGQPNFMGRLPSLPEPKSKKKQMGKKEMMHAPVPAKKIEIKRQQKSVNKQTKNLALKPIPIAKKVIPTEPSDSKKRKRK